MYFCYIIEILSAKSESNPALKLRVRYEKVENEKDSVIATVSK